MALVIVRVTHQRWIRDNQIVAEREYWETTPHDPAKPPRNYRKEIILPDGTRLVEDITEFGQYAFNLEDRHGS